MAGPGFWARLPRPPCRFRESCCACCRNARFAAWVPIKRGGSAARSDGIIGFQDLPDGFREYGAEPRPTDVEAIADASEQDWPQLSEIEGRYVARVLQYTRGNKQAASRVLGVDRKTLDRMIKRHHIDFHRRGNGDHAVSTQEAA